jgi:CRP/FNR family cyclic AMP-dependent transcriptional regulator
MRIRCLAASQFSLSKVVGVTTSPGPRKFGLFRHAPKTTVHPAGATIFREGDAGQSMFAIKRGRVALMVDGNTVDILTEEEIFGEMALLEHAARTATSVTLEETELVEIDEAHFYLLIRQNPPFALQLMRLLSERLRRADALYRRPQEP